jgi:hypothetical protein
VVIIAKYTAMRKFWKLCSSAGGGTVLSLALVAITASFHTPSAQQRTSDPITVPDFVGTAAPITPASSCPKILPDNMRNPFTSGTQSVTVADYQLVGCWRGTLAGKKFIIDEYFSPQAGGGIAVEYGGIVVARLLTGTGAPTIVRFTGTYACDAEQAGAYFQAVNLQTGVRMDDKQAQIVCAPPEWPPKYVLGLGTHRYPVIWPKLKLQELRTSLRSYALTPKTA